MKERKECLIVLGFFIIHILNNDVYNVDDNYMTINRSKIK